MKTAPQALPEHALLARYAGDGGYTDCYATDLPGNFSQAEYVAAFYTTWLFKLERVILKLLVAKPSTDQQAEELARGGRASFAAWTVEASAPNQLLMRDFLGNTRSWLMVEPRHEGGVTRLYFGSGGGAAQRPRRATEDWTCGFARCWDSTSATRARCWPRRARV